MKPATFTSDGERIVIRRGSGLPSSEADWRIKPTLRHGRCEGAGWLWPHQVGDHVTDQRYDCHECGGLGLVPDIDHPTSWSCELDSIRYTVTVTALPLDEYLPMAMVLVTAESAATSSGDRPVVVVAEWRERVDHADELDRLEQAYASICVCHRWVDLVLRAIGGKQPTGAEVERPCPSQSEPTRTMHPTSLPI
jgi:hypothetical protein